MLLTATQCVMFCHLCATVVCRAVSLCSSVHRITQYVLELIISTKHVMASATQVTYCAVVKVVMCRGGSGRGTENEMASRWFGLVFPPNLHSV